MPGDSNKFGNLTFKVLRPSDNLPMLVEKIQFNFDQILLNGGGPKGDTGTVGMKGEIGATGIGDKGDKGDKGTITWFSTISIIDGSQVTNPDYQADDIVIDINDGTYYLIVDIGGVLYYEYKYSLSSISVLSYLIAQSIYQSTGDTITKWVLRDNGQPDSSTERNLVLGVRKPHNVNSGETQSDFYKLMLGLDLFPGNDDNTLTICNIIQDTVTSAFTNPFSQLSYRFRSDKFSPVSSTKADTKYKISSPWTTFSHENLSTAVYLKHNEVIANSEVHLRGRNVIMSGQSFDENVITEYVKFIINPNNSFVRPVFNLTFQSDNQNGQMIFESNIVVNNRILFKTDVDSGQMYPAGTLDLSTNKTSYSITNNLPLHTITNGKHGQFIILKSDSNFARIQDVTQSTNGNILLGNRTVHYLRKNQQIAFIILDKSLVNNTEISNHAFYAMEVSSSYSNLVAHSMNSSIHGNNLKFFTTPGFYQLNHIPGSSVVTNMPTEFLDISTKNPGTAQWDFKLEVSTEAGGNDIIQKLYSFQLNENNMDPHWIAVEGYYYRNKRNETAYSPSTNNWSSWNQIHLSNHNISINRGITRLPIYVTVPADGYFAINSTGTMGNQRNSNFYIIENPDDNHINMITFPVNTGNWYTLMFKDATIIALGLIGNNIYPKPYLTYRYRAGEVVNVYWDGNNAYFENLGDSNIKKGMILDYWDDNSSSLNFKVDGTGTGDWWGYALCMGQSVNIHGNLLILPELRESYRQNIFSIGDIGGTGGTNDQTLAGVNIPKHRHKYTFQYPDFSGNRATWNLFNFNATQGYHDNTSNITSTGSDELKKGSHGDVDTYMQYANTGAGDTNISSQHQISSNGVTIPFDNRPKSVKVVMIMKL